MKWSQVKVHTYVTGGWVHHHLRGSIEGFRRIRSPKKWLRIHRDFEWPDSYRNETVEDEGLAAHLLDDVSLVGGVRDAAAEALVHAPAGSDLTDLRYLYGYGEYVGPEQLERARHLAELPQESIAAMAGDWMKKFSTNSSMRITGSSSLPS